MVSNLLSLSSKRNRPGTSSDENRDESNKKTKFSEHSLDVQSSTETISLTEINKLDYRLRNYVNDPKYKVGVEQIKHILGIVKDIISKTTVATDARRPLRPKLIIDSWCSSLRAVMLKL